MSERIDSMVLEAIALLQKLTDPRDVERAQNCIGGLCESDVDPPHVSIHVEGGQFVATGFTYAACSAIRGHHAWVSKGQTVEVAVGGLFEQLEKTLRHRSDRRRAEGEALLVEARGYDEAADKARSRKVMR